METSRQGVTQLLRAWSNGDEQALQALVPLVYDELKSVAQRHLARRGGGPTLQATALVHEAYLRLVSRKDLQWNDRTHFFAVTARIIRGILVDHARAHYAAKRGGGAYTLALNDAVAIADRKEVDLLEVDDALKRLTALDEQQGRIVEMRFFAGLSIEETAEALHISRSTVKRDWVLAKTWIHRELTGDPH